MSFSIRIFATIRGLLYALLFVALWWWVVASAVPFDSRIPISIPRWMEGPGWTLIVLGASIDLWCVLSFALVGKGTPAPFDAPREFVAVGPYRYVRNPMYLGAMCIIVGSGCMIRSPSAILVALFFILLAHCFVLTYEEPTLETKFGESYLRYKQSVNRWLPFWRRVPS